MNKVLMILIAALFIASPALADWSGDVTVGAGLSSGSKSSASVSIGMKATQKLENERYGASIKYNYAETGEVLTARDIYGSLKYDKLTDTPVFYYLAVEMLSDEFKDLNLRTTVGPGIGYQILESLSVEGGISCFSEDLDMGADNSWLTMRLGSNFNAEVFGVRLSNTLLANAPVEDVEAYRVRNEAEISLPISTAWAFNLSNVFQYNKKASQSTDSAWVAGLQYNF